MRIVLFLITSLIIAAAAPPPVAALSPWKFQEWSRTTPQRQKIVTLDQFEGAQTFLAFLRSDCAPCLLETKILLEAADHYPALPILFISLQEPKSTKKLFPAKLPANVHMLMATDNPANLLTAFGSENSTLPFSAFLHSDGKICEHHSGIVGSDLISKWVASC